MPPWPSLTVTERCPFPFTPLLTDTAGCGTGRGRDSDPISGQPGRTGTTLTRAPTACRVVFAPATPDARLTATVTVPLCRVTEYAARAGVLPSQPGDQRPASAFGIDPVDQLADLVGGEFPAARQPLHPAPLLTVCLAVRGVDPPGDAEHPGTWRAFARVEGGERRDRLDEGVRGQVGHGLRLRTAPREVGGHRRHVRPVQRLELSTAVISRPAVLRRQAWRR